MDARDTIKKIWFSLYNSGRVVLLDFPVFPAPLYTENNDHPHARLLNLIKDNLSTYNQILKKTLTIKMHFQA